MSEVIQFAAHRVEGDSERLMRILHRQQDMEATQKTLQEIRQLKRSIAKRREGIDQLINRIEEDQSWRLPSDCEVPVS